jgi:hypothetical protein
MFTHPTGGEGDHRKPKEQVSIRPHHAGAHALGGTQQVMMIVPVNGEENKTKNVPSGGRSSSTMMVMMIASTPSLKASSRDVDID